MKGGGEGKSGKGTMQMEDQFPLSRVAARRTMREIKCHSYPRCSGYLKTLLDRSIGKGYEGYYNLKTHKESLAILFLRRPVVRSWMITLPRSPRSSPAPCGVLLTAIQELLCVRRMEEGGGGGAGEEE